MKILGAVCELPAIQYCQSSPFTSKLGQIGQIGSAVQLIAPKWLPGFSFSQLSWVSNIYLMWNPLLRLPSHFLGILFQSQPVCSKIKISKRENVKHFFKKDLASKCHGSYRNPFTKERKSRAMFSFHFFFSLSFLFTFFVKFYTIINGTLPQ